MTRLMDLAKLLGEWQPDDSLVKLIRTNDIWESIWNLRRIDVEGVISSKNPLADVNPELDKKLEEVSEYVSLFRKASLQDRVEARKAFQESAKPINSTFIGAWKPDGYDFAETLSLHLVALAASYGNSYPREYHPDRDDKFNFFVNAVNARGLDWLDFKLEYNLLSAEYLPELIDISQMEMMPDEHFKAEFEKANAAVSASEPSAELYYQRGLLYLKHHDFEKALKDMERAYELDKKRPEILYHLGTAYAALGLIEGARNCYMGVMMRFPTFEHNGEIRAYLDDWRNRLKL